MRILNDNALTRSSMSATSTSVGSSVANLHNGNLFDFWKPSRTGLESVSAFFSEPNALDCIAIAGHNLFEAGVTSLALSFYDANAALIETIEFSVTNNKNIMHTFTLQNATSIKIEMNVVATLPYISCIYLGKSIYTTRTPEFGSELPFVNTNTKASSLSSEMGVVLARIVEVSEGIDLSVSLKSMDLNWVRSNWIPFVESSMFVPFFISLSNAIPDPIYALADNKIQPKLTRPNRADISLKFSGVL